MMKRIIAMTLVVVMVAALFVGCGSNGVEGTYKLKKVNGVDLEEFAKLMGGDEEIPEISMTLKSDGSVVAKGDLVDMSDEESTGTWKQEGDKIVITINGEAQEFDYKDGTLTMSASGFSVTFA
ncbi:MAG: hypothetical protein J5789_00080, partial [Oscillospiraceae bacterium]|nr:hypothetical protein [Oscillospiraceae bacterium]